MMDTFNIMRKRFYKNLYELIETKGKNSVFLTEERYEDLLKKVKEAKGKQTGKTSTDYRRVKRYDILNVGGREKLVFPPLGGSTNIRYYTCTEELFDIIHETHLATGHGGRDKTLKELQKSYKNITCESVMLYLSICPVCQKKYKTHEFVTVNCDVKTEITEELNITPDIIQEPHKDITEEDSEDETENENISQNIAENIIGNTPEIVHRTVQQNPKRTPTKIPLEVKRLKLGEESHELVKDVVNGGEKEKNECTSFGEHVGFRLKKLSDHARAVTIRNISNILFKAVMSKTRIIMVQNKTEIACVLVTHNSRSENS